MSVSLPLCSSAKCTRWKSVKSEILRFQIWNARGVCKCLLLVLWLCFHLSGFLWASLSWHLGMLIEFHRINVPHLLSHRWQHSELVTGARLPLRHASLVSRHASWLQPSLSCLLSKWSEVGTLNWELLGSYYSEGRCFIMVVIEAVLRGPCGYGAGRRGRRNELRADVGEQLSMLICIVMNDKNIFV